MRSAHLFTFDLAVGCLFFTLQIYFLSLFFLSPAFFFIFNLRAGATIMGV